MCIGLLWNIIRFFSSRVDHNDAVKLVVFKKVVLELKRELLIDGLHNANLNINACRIYTPTI